MSDVTLPRPELRKLWPLPTRMQQAEVDLDAHGRMLDAVLDQARHTDTEVKQLALEVAGLRAETKEDTADTLKLRDSLFTLTITVVAAALALCGSLVLVAVRVGG